MSNSPLISYTKLSPHVRCKRVYPVTRITIHHVVGLFTVEGIGACFQTELQKSANLGIGYDGRVGCYVDEDYAAMTSSDWDNDNRAVTIECADEATYPYTFPDAVYSKLIELCVDICKRYGKKKLLWIPNKANALAYNLADDEMLLTVHRWWLATACPGEWAMQHMGEIAEKVTEKLNEKQPDNTPAKWSKEAVEWAVDNGILAGNDKGDLMLRSPITREQMCVILKKFYDTLEGG